MEAETITGLKKALERFPNARAVSIITWGVDWALDGNGELVGDVVAYRDEHCPYPRCFPRAHWRPRVFD